MRAGPEGVVSFGFSRPPAPLIGHELCSLPLSQDDLRRSAFPRKETILPPELGKEESSILSHPVIESLVNGSGGRGDQFFSSSFGSSGDVSGKGTVGGWGVGVGELEVWLSGGALPSLHEVLSSVSSMELGCGRQ